ncbi:MAG TPA: LysM peptidoglycan-binding domain-containing protein [Epsilonproteobacteria bacterium]|nr:LysM peptidoglycan-binding domain-containing protein [Campylobacterota bacterium]
MPLTDKYPSYSYVFEEFDVDHDYIYNKSFTAFLTKNEKRYKNFYKNSLKRGGHLIPTFKSMLIQDGLSDLFVYMSMIESGFSTDCVSCKSAVGIWQFMKATAKQYDLSVNSDFDERLDPILATSAAMNYMHKLYKDFGKWYLVMMAYNCGEGRLARGIKRAGTDDLSVLMREKANYIPKETRNYVKKILMVAMVGENVSLGFDRMGNAVTQLYGENIVQVEVEPGESLDRIAEIIKMKPKDLLKLNHHFKNGKVPVKLPSYKINIPNDKVVDFYAIYILQKELRKYSKTHYLSHVVRTGETLKRIADKYRTSIEEILVYNPVKKKKIKKGEVLVIPVTQKVFEKFSKQNG